MTLENLLSNMGIGSKQVNERYSEYAPSIQDQQVYYAYEPSSPPHGHVTTHVPSSKHNYGSSLKTNASMSALTLLAFLFFLHILQQCIKEHMTDLNTSPLMVMTAGRENEDDISKSVANKLVKTALTQTDTMEKMNVNVKNSPIEKYKSKNPFQYDESAKKSMLTKVMTTEPMTETERLKYEYVYKNDE